MEPMGAEGSGAKVLITGGAGYIGSTIASACLDRGITPVILDSLVTGKREFTRGRAFFEGDISDGALVDKVFAEHPEISAVVHCAALIVVPDSVTDPIGYYQANVSKSLDMVQHLVRNGCTRMLFSSSAAIYSPGDDLSVDEDSPIGPQSPYARTKAVCEQMFADIAAAEPLRVLSLRYFNPIGADPKLRTGLQVAEPTHAVGRLVMAQQSGEPFRITGTDYPTRDGTGIRDYLHVWDLAEAHLSALEAFDTVLADRTSAAINLGTGLGTTVRELVAAFNSVSDIPVTAIDAPRRPGDAAGAYTRSARAAELLGWRARFSVADGIADALRWAAIRDQMLA
jgi:UDP-glucose 4-epimerase